MLSGSSSRKYKQSGRIFSIREEKVDCGIDFLTTQMFLIMRFSIALVENCAIAGIDVPLIAGMRRLANANRLKEALSFRAVLFPKVYENP